MDYILDNLAIGSFYEARSRPRGIDALLCVARERDLGKTDCLYYKVPMEDMEPAPEDQLKDAIVFIRDNIAQHKIMVFCNAGVGRSPSVVISYLCCVLDYDFGRAVEFVAKRRPYISPLPNLIVSIKAAKELLHQADK